MGVSKHFIDRLRIFVRAGSGAPGNPAVRGKGGDGGSIFLEASDKVTLSKLLEKNPTKRFNAEHGKEASKRRGLSLGNDGSSLTIPVPTGVTVLFGGQGNSSTSADGSKSLGDLDRPGQKLLVAQGGLGGIQQTGYLGSPGQAHSIILDLKLMADYSLLGFPNAGKSSLLKALSGTPAKIASYPFTTLQPQIAYCRYPDHRQLSLTDLPGLADIYASYSVNLKDPKFEFRPAELPELRHTKFLKHVERNSCLIMVLDALGFRKDQHSPWRSPLASCYLVLHLLERWCHGLLLNKPMVCVINKIDLPGATDAALESKYFLERLDSEESIDASELPLELIPRYKPQFKAVRLVSAKSQTHIPELKQDLRLWLDEIELEKRRDQLDHQADLQRSKVEKALVDSEASHF